MLYSMTGFGESSLDDDRVHLGFRIRGVNHKGLDVNVRLPVELMYLESRIRNCVSDAVYRGRVDISTEFTAHQADMLPPMTLDVGRLDQLLRVSREIMEHPMVVGPMDVNTLIRIPDLVVAERTGYKLPDDIETKAIDTLSVALESFLASRLREGEMLLTDIQTRIRLIRSHAEDLANTVEDRREDLMASMRRRLDVIRAEVELDEQRLYQEVIYWADRLDVSEEITRLNAHLEKMDQDLADPCRPLGKKLEFLVQEMLREVTTVGNKAKSKSISALIVVIKTELEKVREQLANIE